MTITILESSKVCIFQLRCSIFNAQTITKRKYLYRYNLSYPFCLTFIVMIPFMQVHHPTLHTIHPLIPFMHSYPFTVPFFVPHSNATTTRQLYRYTPWRPQKLAHIYIKSDSLPGFVIKGGSGGGSRSFAPCCHREFTILTRETERAPLSSS